jgi:hypothetical protein
VIILSESGLTGFEDSKILGKLPRLEKRRVTIEKILESQNLANPDSDKSNLHL